MIASRWLGSAGTLVLALSSQARAAEPVRLQYSATAGCPSQDAFTERVRARTSHVELAEPGQLARSFSVALEVSAGGVVGRVDFVDVDGVPVSRVVRGDTCDEVVESLALVTALALDATLNEAVPEPPPLEPPVGAATTQAERPSPPPPPPVAPRSAEPAPGAATAGVGAGYIGWAGPGGGLGLDAFFAWSFRPQGPSLRLSAWHFRSSDESGGHQAVFRGWGGRLEGCPWTLARNRFFVEPCLGTNLGLFRAEGVKDATVSHAETSNLFWRDVLLVGRVGARLGRRVVVEAQGDLAFPLLRQKFGFNDPSGQPTGTVYEIPVVSGGAELHVGVRFP